MSRQRALPTTGNPFGYTLAWEAFTEREVVSGAMPDTGRFTSG